MVGSHRVSGGIPKKKKPTKKKRKLPDDGIKVVRATPPGFLSLTEFSERCGVVPSSISRAKTASKFSNDDMRWLVPDASSKPKLYLHWDRAGIPYVVSRGRDKWPEGFEAPEAYLEEIGFEERQDKRDKDKARKEEKEEVEKDFTTVGRSKNRDMNASKKRKEDLIILEKEFDLQVKFNEYLKLDEVISLLSAVATETRQGMKSMIARNKKILAGEDDAFTIGEMLDTEFNIICDELDVKLEAFLNGEDASEDLEEWELEVMEGK